MYVNQPAYTMNNEVKFYLEKRKDKQTGRLIVHQVPILLFYSFNGQRLQYFTGMRIDAQKWDGENMKAKRNYSEAAEVNKELVRLKAKVEEFYDKAKVLDIAPTVEYFKENLRGNFNDSTVRKTFYQYFEEYMQKGALTKSKSWAEGVKGTINILKEFSRITNYSISFEKITQDFYENFLSFCFYKKEYYNNYTGKLIKDLKAFMNWATDRGYNTNMAFLRKEFVKLREEPEIIFLNYDEVLKLMELKLEKREHKEVRDLYCFGCFTGIRHSDLVALSEENVHKDHVLFRVKKTTEANSVPLNKYSRKILDRNKGKYLGKCLPQLSLLSVNKYLKELIKEAKITRKVQITHYRGAEAIVENLPMYEAITFHTSKKTFMTNFLARGGNLHTAMAITGNRSYSTAKRYFKVVDALKTEEMNKVFA